MDIERRPADDVLVFRAVTFHLTRTNFRERKTRKMKKDKSKMKTRKMKKDTRKMRPKGDVTSETRSFQG